MVVVAAVVAVAAVVVVAGWLLWELLLMMLLVRAGLSLAVLRQPFSEQRFLLSGHNSNQSTDATETAMKKSCCDVDSDN